MLRLIIFLILLVASVWAGVEIMQHPGYLLIVFQPWMVQMPIWFAVLAVVLFFLLFYLLIDSIDRFNMLWFRFKNWLRFRQERQFYSKTQQGFSALLESRFKKAEQLLLAGVSQTVEPLINYICAAKAAHELKAFDRRDHYLQKAYQIAPQSKLAIGITQGELEFDQHQYGPALVILNELKQESPRHPAVLKLLEKIYTREANWPQLLNLISPMRKAKVFNASDIDLLEKNIYCQMLTARESMDLEELQSIWGNIPRSLRAHPDVVYAYVKQLRTYPDREKEIEELIRKVLKYHWHSGLINIYADLPFQNLNRQLVIAGAWLKQYGPRQETLLLLGKLCVRVQLWGKAKDYFERCLALGPNPQASLEYGKLLEHLDEVDAAKQQYQKALEQIVLNND